MNRKAVTISMAHTTFYARSSRHLLAWLAARFARTPRGRLDPRTLSDHLKRDMGFLDGNDVASGLRWQADAGSPPEYLRDLGI